MRRATMHEVTLTRDDLRALALKALPADVRLANPEDAIVAGHEDRDNNLTSVTITWREDAEVEA